MHARCDLVPDIEVLVEIAKVMDDYDFGIAWLVDDVHKTDEEGNDIAGYLFRAGEEIELSEDEKDAAVDELAEEIERRIDESAHEDRYQA
ncbi:MAG: hypothetical protein ABIP97_02470 [Chthoniobacterales bacterium]